MTDKPQFCTTNWRPVILATLTQPEADAERLVAECAPYLKEDETPLQRIERDHRDMMALMRLLAAEKIKNEALTAPATSGGVSADALTDAARDVLAERQRQVSVEGWTPDHDDAHDDGSLACAASCYACAAAGLADAERDWPWNGGFKPADPRRMLVKAGALILAEIERLDRAAPKQEQPK